MIEMTLDQCVQRLRKRIADEALEDQRQAEAEYEQYHQQQQQQPRSALGGQSRRSKMDRTPSFYTTKSVVNLSGLSVTDRAPPGTHEVYHGQAQQQTQGPNYGVRGTGLRRRGSSSRNSSRDQLHVLQVAPPQQPARTDSDSQLSQRGSFSFCKFILFHVIT
jgi:hypothetical protein